MSEAGAGMRSGETMREGDYALTKAMASFLHFAAAPTFAIMALLTCVFGGGPTDVLCSTAGSSSLGGMVPMYLLMSAFHSAPWLRLVAGQRSGGS